MIKPRIKKLNDGRWWCGSTTPRVISVGATPAKAYQNWYNLGYSMGIFM
jgi:hypothetical protein